jgi:hypothetical protein
MKPFTRDWDGLGVLPEEQISESLWCSCHHHFCDRRGGRRDLEDRSLPRRNGGRRVADLRVRESWRKATVLGLRFKFEAGGGNRGGGVTGVRRAAMSPPYKLAEHKDGEVGEAADVFVS